MKASTPETATARQLLRRRLLESRRTFQGAPQAAAAGAALASYLVKVLLEVAPRMLGVYSPRRSEFNAVPAIAADENLAALPLALPFAQRAPIRMHYRAWDGHSASVVDECGIASSAGAAVLPDVLLVPCVGFTTEGFRLGYGAGYFDRWLEQHPDTTTVGVAWAFSRIDAALLDPQPHDRALTLIVTEHGVV